MKDPLTKLAHLAALSAMAVALPFLGTLTQNVPFFAVHRATRLDAFLLGALVLLGPPCAIFACTIAVRVLCKRDVHVIAVGALAGAVVLPLVRPIGTLAALTAALLAGWSFGAGYARSEKLRSLVTWLLPAPAVFALVYAFSSPATATLFPSRFAAGAHADRAPLPPVIMVVFDEFALGSLLDTRLEIDAERYPSFARLRAHSTWFRRARAVAIGTLQAVPAILSGTQPNSDRAPDYASFPNNLFTLLAPTHAMRVHEGLTFLCPEPLCTSRPLGMRAPLPVLLGDASILLAHAVAPKDLADAVLPSIEGRWRDLLPAEDALDPPTRDFEAFLAGIGLDDEPALHFLHVLLPHVPHRYLPTGQRFLHSYEGTDEQLRDREPGGPTDVQLVTQLYQRHLLQVGYVDALLGRLLDRLDATGLYDRALVIITADHGVSYRPGLHRRGLDGANAADITAIPLFVKLPSQKTARVDDGDATSADILPTVLATLGIPPPSTVEGRSLLAPRAPTRPRIFQGIGGLTTLDRTPDVAETARYKAAIFGEGSRDGLFGIGPRPDLVLRDLPRDAIEDDASFRATLDAPDAYEAISLTQSTLPVHVTGSLTQPATVAIVVNGTVGAVVTAQDRFSAIVPWWLLRAGKNDVTLYAADGPRLRRIPLADEEQKWHLERDGQLARGGRALPLGLGGGGRLDGCVRNGDVISVYGWAADLGALQPARAVLLFAGDRLWARPRLGAVREDVATVYHSETLTRAGFALDVPADRYKQARGQRLRAFGVTARGDAVALDVAGSCQQLFAGE